MRLFVQTKEHVDDPYMRCSLFAFSFLCSSSAGVYPQKCCVIYGVCGVELKDNSFRLTAALVCAFELCANTFVAAMPRR